MIFFGKRKLRKKQEKIETAKALDNFVQQIYWGNDLNPLESEKNLEDGLVELTWEKPEQHAANGLIITNNGYFLTANHCLDDYYKQLRVKLNGNLYSIEKICAISKTKDIVLAKAEVPIISEPQCKKYRIANTNKLERTAVCLLSRWNGEINRSYGYSLSAIELSGKYENGDKINLTSQISLDLKVKKGDSGGIALNTGRELIGIANSKSEEQCFCTKIIQALELIDVYKRHLQEK